MSADRPNNRIISMFLTTILVLGVFMGMSISASAAPIGLSAPTNVRWDEDEPWLAEWETVKSPSGEYNLRLYKDGELVSEYGGVSANTEEGKPAYLDYSADIRVDGEYYFEVQTMGDGINYMGSAWVRSAPHLFELPEAQLPAPQGLQSKKTDGHYALTWEPVQHEHFMEYHVYVYEANGDEYVFAVDVDGEYIETEILIVPEDYFMEIGNGKYSFGVRAVSDNIFECRSSEISEIVPITAGTTTTPTPTPGGGSSGTSGGRGGSSRGGSSGGNSKADGDRAATTATTTTTSRSNNVSSSGSVNQSQITSEVAQAVAAAAGNTVTVQTRNATSISSATLRAMAAAAGNKSVVLHADTLSDNGKSVQGRLYIEPEKLAGLSSDLLLSVKTDSKSTQAVERFFESYYNNDVEVVHCDQQGSFGATLRIAAKVDLSKLDTTNLVFYSYDKAANTFARIANPNYFIDANGYLHFYTERAGDIIISDRPLVKK